MLDSHIKYRVGRRVTVEPTRTAATHPRPLETIATFASRRSIGGVGGATRRVAACLRQQGEPKADRHFPGCVTVSADFLLAMIEMPERMSMDWWRARDKSDPKPPRSAKC